MKVFDRYLLKNLIIATLLTAVTLVTIIFMTQSLRFLELVINSGASSSMFWILTVLALPRFFEIILPIALMAATVFIYNKLVMDSELIVMRSVGIAPLELARPAIYLAISVSMFLLLVTTWLAPVSLSGMQHLRQVVKAQYSSFLFQDGVFNAIIPGLTVFVRERTGGGELHGLMIHDSREDNEMPVTVLAERGIIVSTEEGQQVVVYDGSRQDINPKTGVLNRLDFERYTIDLPDGAGTIRQRWQEPDERTFWQLLNPDKKNKRDLESRREFMVEIHRRIVSPFLAISFTMMALCAMLLGAVERRGQGWRVVTAISSTVIVQALYLGAFNLARDSNFGLILMYILVFLPLAVCLFILSTRGEDFRQKYLWPARQNA